MKKVLIGVVVLVVAFLGFVATRPADVRVERSMTMASPAEVVFAQVNDFQKWATWSPWDKMEPTQKRSFGTPAAGPGATYAWVGEKTGEGKMTISESKPNERIDIKLEFIKPMAATNEVSFLIVPTGNDVKVTWTFSGKNNFVGKLFSVFMNVDDMLGKQFDEGLTSLKAVSEAEAKKLAEKKVAEAPLAGDVAPEAVPAAAPAAAPAPAAN